MSSVHGIGRWALMAALLGGTASLGACGGPDQVTTTDRTLTTTTGPAPAYPMVPPATATTTTTTHTEQQ
ncbi:MAG: hypothetical protein WDN04_07885 [Rhodospirillales bacterium]